MRAHQLLLTNDDGVLAEGLSELYKALRGRFAVRVLAPDGERSGVAHGVSLTRSLGSRELPPLLQMEGRALGGTPVDCVKAAVSGLFGARPSCVVSGMNHGENTGLTVYNSGTVAAAREAAFYGLPAFAVSLEHGAQGALAGYAACALRVIVGVLAGPAHRPGVYYNINIPARDPEEMLGVQVCRLHLAPFDDRWELSTTAAGHSSLRLRGGSREPASGPDFDAAALAEGWITLTPLLVDATAGAQLGLLADALANTSPSAALR